MKLQKSHIFILVVGFILFVVLVRNLMYGLPKIVWLHWDTDDMPEVCKMNLARTRRILHDWDVRFFTTADFLTWCTPPPEFFNLSIWAKSDFMRLWLLERHGGVWMDMGIRLNESINPIYEECVRTRSELAGFYILGKTTNAQCPVFENWFIMAPPQSRMVRLWFEEYKKAIQQGFVHYKKNTIRDGVNAQEIFDSEEDVYLTQHLCFQKVIQQKICFPRILYMKAEDTMFHIHAQCNWNFDCMRRKFHSKESLKVPYIKLRGCDRPLFPFVT